MNEEEIFLEARRRVMRDNTGRDIFHHLIRTAYQYASEEMVGKARAWDINSETIKAERRRIAEWIRQDPGSVPANATLLSELASAIEGGAHTTWAKVRRDD